MLDTTGEAVNASARLANLGITMDNTAAMAMLSASQATTPSPACSKSESGPNLAWYFAMDAASAMTAYGMDPATYAAVAGWAGG